MGTFDPNAMQKHTQHRGDHSAYEPVQVGFIYPFSNLRVFRKRSINVLPHFSEVFWWHHRLSNFPTCWRQSKVKQILKDSPFSCVENASLLALVVLSFLSSVLFSTSHPSYCWLVLWCLCLWTARGSITV